MPVLHLIPFIISYLAWHYSLGLLDLMSLWRNFLWLSGHIFSIPLLLRTLFSPWKRMSEDYPKGLNLSNLGEALLVNTLMRLVGAVVRLFAVLAGFVFAGLIIVFGMATLVLWLAMPVVVPLIALFGAYAIVFGNILFL
jgi:hypothetical protein